MSNNVQLNNNTTIENTASANKTNKGLLAVWEKTLVDKKDKTTTTKNGKTVTAWKVMGYTINVAGASMSFTKDKCAEYVKSHLGGFVGSLTNEEFNKRDNSVLEALKKKGLKITTKKTRGLSEEDAEKKNREKEKKARERGKFKKNGEPSYTKSKPKPAGFKPVLVRYDDNDDRDMILTDAQGNPIIDWVRVPAIEVDTNGNPIVADTQVDSTYILLDNGKYGKVVMKPPVGKPNGTPVPNYTYKAEYAAVFKKDRKGGGDSKITVASFNDLYAFSVKMDDLFQAGNVQPQVSVPQVSVPQPEPQPVPQPVPQGQFQAPQGFGFNGGGFNNGFGGGFQA